MEVEVANCSRHRRVYQVDRSADSNGNTTFSKKLVRIELFDGYLLWEIVASYEKNHPHIPYYMIAPNKPEALRRFKTIIPWLDHIVHVLPLSNERTAEILNNPTNYIIW